MLELNNQVRGTVGVYKPKGVSSHWLINRVRKITGIKKVGHAGTLDPLAEGVLVVGIGREATKKLWLEKDNEKVYLAEIKLGENSTTDDEEGEKQILKQVQDDDTPSYGNIKNVVSGFIGEIWQVPPDYSAVKFHGNEAYKYKRLGQEVKLEPRKRLVKEIEILEYNYPILKLRVVTGSGVYIRSLARDMGEKLGTGGYLASLIRTRVGSITIEDCYTVVSSPSTGSG